MASFKEYLDGRKESAYDFSKRSGLCLNTVYKLIHDLPVRYATIKVVIKATKKQVTEKDLKLAKKEYIPD